VEAIPLDDGFLIATPADWHCQFLVQFLGNCSSHPHIYDNVLGDHCIEVLKKAQMYGLGIDIKTIAFPNSPTLCSCSLSEWKCECGQYISHDNDKYWLPHMYLGRHIDVEEGFRDVLFRHLLLVSVKRATVVENNIGKLFRHMVETLPRELMYMVLAWTFDDVSIENISEVWKNFENSCKNFQIKKKV